MGRIAIVVAIIGTFMPSIALADNIRCKDIEKVFETVLDTTMKTIEVLMENFDTLAKDSTDQKRDVVRRKLCAAGGEALGLYKAVSMQIDVCVTSGESLGTLPADVRGYVDQTETTIKGICG